MSRATVALAFATSAFALAALVLAALAPATVMYPPPNLDNLTFGPSLLAQNAVTETFYPFAIAVIVAAIAIATPTVMAVGKTVRVLLIWGGVIALGIVCVATLPGESTIVTPARAAATIGDSLGIGLYLVPSLLSGLTAGLFALLAGNEAEAAAWTRGTSTPRPS